MSGGAITRVHQQSIAGAGHERLPVCVPPLIIAGNSSKRGRCVLTNRCSLELVPLATSYLLGNAYNHIFLEDATYWGIMWMLGIID